MFRSKLLWHLLFTAKLLCPTRAAHQLAQDGRHAQLGTGGLHRLRFCVDQQGGRGLEVRQEAAGVAARPGDRRHGVVRLADGNAKLATGRTDSWTDSGAEEAGPGGQNNK